MHIKIFSVQSTQSLVFYGFPYWRKNSQFRPISVLHILTLESDRGLKFFLPVYINEMLLPIKFQCSRASRSSKAFWTKTSFSPKIRFWASVFQTTQAYNLISFCLVWKTQLWCIAWRKNKLVTDRNASGIDTTFWKTMQLVISFLASSCFLDF